MKPIYRNILLTSALSIGGGLLLYETFVWLSGPRSPVVDRRSVNPPGAAPSPAQAVIPKSSPSISVASVDRIYQRLDWGNIVFNAPSTMQYAQPQLIEMLLSPSLSVVDLQEQLRQKGGSESARIRLSNRMEAQLTGQGFAIQTLTPELQAVTSRQTTRWRWEATPTEFGQRSLHFTLSAQVKIDGSDTPLVVRTFDREMLVKISLAQRVSGFVANNWQWLWAAVAAPIAGYWFKRGKKRIAKPKRNAG
jgi:hypothetical protein